MKINKMKTFEVTIPVLVEVEVTVQAVNEEDAIEYCREEAFWKVAGDYAEKTVVKWADTDNGDFKIEVREV